jgi:hypothetical protein
LDEVQAAADAEPEKASLQRKLEAKHMAMRPTEQKFKDAINMLLVDCLEAVVTNNQQKQNEKFGLLAKFGKDSGFTNASKMAEIGAARGGGGERYAHRR